MSNPNFVNDLVMMAKAFEELPNVKSELEAKSHDFNTAQQMIQRLELRLIDAKNELDAAHAATRKAEVERDHAETMFLELDEKAQTALRFLGQVQGMAVQAEVALSPPKPEPIVPVATSPMQGHDAVTAEQAEVKVGAFGGKVSMTDPFDDGGPYNEGERAMGESVTSTDHTQASADTASLSSEPVHSDSVQPKTEEAPRSTDPTAASSWPTTPSSPPSAPDASAVSGESAASSTTGERIGDPLPTPEATDGIGRPLGESATDPTSNTELTQSDGSGAQSDKAPTSDVTEGVSVPSDPTPATESSSESASNASASQPETDPEPSPRYTPEWYVWADRVDYWNVKRAAQ